MKKKIQDLVEGMENITEIGDLDDLAETYENKDKQILAYKDTLKEKFVTSIDGIASDSPFISKESNFITRAVNMAYDRLGDFCDAQSGKDLPSYCSIVSGYMSDFLEGSLILDDIFFGNKELTVDTLSMVTNRFAGLASPYSNDYSKEEFKNILKKNITELIDNHFLELFEEDSYTCNRYEDGEDYEPSSIYTLEGIIRHKNFNEFTELDILNKCLLLELCQWGINDETTKIDCLTSASLSLLLCASYKNDIKLENETLSLRTLSLLAYTSYGANYSSRPMNLPFMNEPDNYNSFKDCINNATFIKILHVTYVIANCGFLAGKDDEELDTKINKVFNMIVGHNAGYIETVDLRYGIHSPENKILNGDDFCQYGLYSLTQKKINKLLVSIIQLLFNKNIEELCVKGNCADIVVKFILSALREVENKPKGYGSKFYRLESQIKTMINYCSIASYSDLNDLLVTIISNKYQPEVRHLVLNASRLLGNMRFITSAKILLVYNAYMGVLGRPNNLKQTDDELSILDEPKFVPLTLTGILDNCSMVSRPFYNTSVEDLFLATCRIINDLPSVDCAKSVTEVIMNLHMNNKLTVNNLNKVDTSTIVSYYSICKNDRLFKDKVKSLIK